MRGNFMKIYENPREALHERNTYSLMLDPYKFAWLVIESWPEVTVVVKRKNPTPLCKKQLEEFEAKTGKSFDRKCYNLIKQLKSNNQLRNGWITIIYACLCGVINLSSQ